MDFIRVMGEILAEKIKKEVMPSRGLIRLAIKKDLPEKDINKLSYKDFLFVFQNGLKEKLELIRVPNVEKVIDEMISELKLKQSLITISI